MRILLLLCPKLWESVGQEVFERVDVTCCVLLRHACVILEQPDAVLAELCGMGHDLPVPNARDQSRDSSYRLHYRIDEAIIVRVGETVSL